MAIRKSSQETFVVAGQRDEWLGRCKEALETQRFTRVAVSEALFQVTANYKKLTTWGDIQVTLRPEGDTSTRIDVEAHANIDNLFALFKSPGRTIINEFKRGL